MISLILLGAGKGERMGFPKSFLKVENYPLYFFSLHTFLKFEEIKEVILVVPAGKKSLALRELRKFGLDRQVKVVKGGRTRTESLKNGLKYAKGTTILIHDVSRPLVTKDLVKRVIKTKGEVVVPYLNLYDTAYEGKKILKRDKVKIIQTPQKIRKELLLQAFRKSKGESFPDESTMIMELLGKNPKYVKGSLFNFKLTYPNDLPFFRVLWKGTFIPLVGWGYDLHLLKKGRNLYLGGIKIPSIKGALGHSDGDVLIHSIVDAILGALGEGDIGTYFPDDEPRWRDVRSEVFLKRCVEMIEDRDVLIGNIDCVIFLERPKLGKYKEKIKKNLGRILKIPEDKISIKAKTSEGIGIIGKGEAIASYSVCLLFQKILPPLSSILKTIS